MQDWQALLERERPPWELLLSLALLALFAYLSRRAANRLAQHADSRNPAAYNASAPNRNR